MINAEIHPALTRNLPLPVTAGVVVHQLLLFWHPKQLVKFHYGFLKFFCIIIFLNAIDFVVLSDDALVGSERSTQHISCHGVSDILIIIAVWAKGHNSYCNVKKEFCLSYILLLFLLFIQLFTLFKAVWWPCSLPCLCQKQPNTSHLPLPCFKLTSLSQTFPTTLLSTHDLSYFPFHLDMLSEETGIGFTRKLSSRMKEKSKRKKRYVIDKREYQNIFMTLSRPGMKEKSKRKQRNVSY